MKYSLLFFSLVFVIASFFIGGSACADTRFTYNIIMWNSPIAEASIVERDNKRYRGKRVTKLFGTLKTREKWKNVKDLNNGMVTIIDHGGFALQTSANINNGGKSKEYSFSYHPYQAVGYKRQGNKKQNILRRTRHKHFHDGLSWLQHVRQSDLHPDKTFGFEVFNLGRFYKVRAVVQAVENVKTPLGDKKSYRIKFTMSRNIKGKRKTTNSVLWISADDRRIPVQMLTPTKLGLAKVLINKVEKY